MEKENESQKNTNSIFSLNEPQKLYSKDLTVIDINEFKEGEIIETENYIFERCGDTVHRVQKNKQENKSIKDDNNYDNEINIKDQESEDNKSESENFPEVMVNSELEKKMLKKLKK